MITKEPFIIIKSTSDKNNLLKGLLYAKIKRLQKLFGRAFITQAVLKDSEALEKEVVLTITGHDFQVTHSHKAESIELIVESLFVQIAEYLHKPYVLA